MTARVLVVLIWFSFAAVDAVGQFDSYGRWMYSPYAEPAVFRLDLYSAQEADTGRTKWAALDVADDDEWAGEYHRDYGEMPTTAHLRWNPLIGFAALHVHPCAPDVIGIAWGSAELTAESVTLRPEVVRGRMPSERRYVFARWGERRYLIPDVQMKTFCEYVSGLGVQSGYEAVDFFVRRGDEGKPVAELPDVPQAYRRFIRSPVTARIIAVKPRSSRLEDPAVRVRLDAGSETGLRRGLSVYFTQDGVRVSLTINRVGRRWAEASYLFSYPVGGASTAQPPPTAYRLGTVVTTRPA
jgi:hypothetical protein